MAKKHVFLSYCHENRKDVELLRNELIVAGEKVWWDRDMLPGADWKQEIYKAMRDAYAVVLCLSKESQQRNKSGIFPEADDAIEAYREYAPGSIYLIPVRLSDCEVPPIAINATLRLDRLLWVDLFPPGKRAEGVERVIQAVQNTPDHP